MKSKTFFLVIAAFFLSCEGVMDHSHNSQENSSIPLEQNEPSEEVGNNEDENNEDEVIVGGILKDMALFIVITDKDNNDRLNPESSAYFGDVFIKGINVMYLCDGKKLSFLDYYYYTGGGTLFVIDDVKNHNPISPPAPYWATLCYYNIDCSRGTLTSVIEDGKMFTYTYICYPDGNEDEIKVQIYNEKTDMGWATMLEKIWINGELAADFSNNVFCRTDKYAYFNPKFYPWMEPSYDTDGNYWGMKPKAGSIVVITK
jgi:hypothetical protein